MVAMLVKRRVLASNGLFRVGDFVLLAILMSCVICAAMPTRKMQLHLLLMEICMQEPSIQGAKANRFHPMAQANAGGVGQGIAQQPGFVPNDDGPPAPAAALPAAAAGQVAHGVIAMAGPGIAHPAGALQPPHPHFDIEAALLISPLPSKNDIRCDIHPKIH